MNIREILRRLERLESDAVEEDPDALILFHADEHPEIDGKYFTPAEAREIERRLGLDVIRIVVRDEPPEKR